MTGWISGVPRNRGKFRWSAGALIRPEPQADLDKRVEWRMCGICGSRNAYVGIFPNQNYTTRCVPDCATARHWANQIKEVTE